MRPLRVAALSLPALLLASAASPGNIVPCAPGIPATVICLTGNVSDTAGGGPLESGKIYHLSGITTVPAGQKLTVEDGAILKFHPLAEFNVRGTLDCGAAIFTSLEDDTAGGDTNGDGPSFGTPGDWIGVFFFFGASAASEMTAAQVRYATTGIANFSIAGDSADITLDQVAVTFSSSYGLSMDGRPTVTNCSFDNNTVAVKARDVASLPGFLGNSATDNILGDCVEITNGAVNANLVIGPQNSLNGRPFAAACTFVVAPGVTLDLQPGTIFKFGAIYSGGGDGTVGGFFVLGTLLTDGVVLTSLEDDTIGGDLDKDGPTFGTPGDWGIIELQPAADASALKNTLVRFGGKIGIAPFAGPMIDLAAADVLLDGVDVTECSGQGLRLNAGAQSSFPTVTGSSFTDNLGAAVDRVPVGAVAGFSNNVAANNLIDTMEVAGGNLEGFAGIDKANSLNDDGAFLMGATLNVQPGAELSLGAGVVLKWPVTTSVLNVDGILTAIGTEPEPVVLTSRVDDAIVGDSNKDGGATVPAPGDWVGVDLGPVADASVLDGVVVRYAGRATQANAAIETLADATIANTVVELSETGGLDLNNAARPTVTDSTFRDNGGLAVAKAVIRALPGFSGCSATNNALGDFIEVVNGDVSFLAPGPVGTLEFGPVNALAPDLVFVLRDDIDVPAGSLLSILGGTIVKFDGNREFDVDGSLQVGSVGGGTAVFTTALDDSVAGDTLKDGSTEGAPGAWQGLVVSDLGTAIDDALVRYAGAFGVAGQTGIALQDADAQLTNVRIEDCLGAGLHLGFNSLPLVDNCSFDRNDIAVDGVPIRALPGFSNSTALDNKVGDYQRITEGTVAADLLVQASQSVIGGVFVLATDVSVLPGATLTLDPSTTFKADGDRLVDVDGTLITNGPVVFTTLPDDINGDTNKDMDTTAPVPGSWEGFSFSDGSDASVLGDIRVRYAGSGVFGAGPSLRLDRADIKVLDSTIEFSAGQGMLLSNDARPEVRRTRFVDNLGVPIGGLTVGAIAGFDDNTGVGNVPGDYMRVTSGTIGGDATVARRNALNGDGVFVVAASVQVNAPDTLTLGQGTIFKFDGAGRSLTANTGTVNVAGTGLEPVVLTHVNDDGVGGDTKKDGTATAPAPGAWNRFEVGFAAGPSSVEHLHARYGGSGAIASIELESDFATARSIRADFSSTDGIRGHRHLGDAANWVAFGCLGDGIELAGGGYDALHPTAAGNGGVGIRKVFGHVGSLWNAVSFGNTGAPVAGFLPGEVFFSDAGPDFAGFDGNIDADPLFGDLANGDLTLGAGSPCIDAADLAAALTVVKDHVEASRVLDHDLDGTALADMGAFERAAYTLAVGGEPKLGTVMSFTVQGSAPGNSLVVLGFLDGTTFVPPFGFTLFGTFGTQIQLGAVPVGLPVFVTMPSSVAFVDMPFGIQGVGLPAGLPGLGNVTNVYRGRLFP